MLEIDITDQTLSEQATYGRELGVRLFGSKKTVAEKIEDNLEPLRERKRHQTILLRGIALVMLAVVICSFYAIYCFIPAHYLITTWDWESFWMTFIPRGLATLIFIGFVSYILRSFATAVWSIWQEWQKTSKKLGQLELILKFIEDPISNEDAYQFSTGAIQQLILAETGNHAASAGNTVDTELTRVQNPKHPSDQVPAPIDRLPP